jgi:hypothetical protein
MTVRDASGAEERLRSIWLELLSLDDPLERGKAIADALNGLAEAEAAFCLDRLIMLEPGVANLSDPRGALPFPFGIRVELFRRKQARVDDRRELAAAVADELVRRDQEAGAGASAAKPKSKRGRPSVKAADDERLAQLMDKHPGDERAVGSAFVRELALVGAKTAKTRLSAARRRLRPVNPRN